MSNELIEALTGLEVLEMNVKQKSLKCEACFDLVVLSAACYFVSDESDHDAIPVTLCLECLEKTVSDDQYKQILKDVMFLSSEEARQEMDEKLRRPKLDGDTEEDLAFFLEDLSMAEPEFFKNLCEFNDGSYTLDNGSEDSFLSDLHRKIAKEGQTPTTKQVAAFNNKCGKYLMMKREGDELIDPVTLRKAGSDVKEKLDAVNSMSKALDTKERKIIVDFLNFFEQRGYLTDKQFFLLRKIESIAISRTKTDD